MSSEVKSSFVTEQNVCGILIFLQHVSYEGTTSQNCVVSWYNFLHKSVCDILLIQA
jgi:hypothetical protein